MVTVVTALESSTYGHNANGRLDVDLTDGAHGGAEDGIDIPDPTSDTRSMLPTKYSV